MLPIEHLEPKDASGFIVVGGVWADEPLELGDDILPVSRVHGVELRRQKTIDLLVDVHHSLPIPPRDTARVSTS